MNSSEFDIGAPVVILGGLHTGCWELFVNDSVVRPLAGAPDDSENECYESD